jgi:hypothetical protein
MQEKTQTPGVQKAVHEADNRLTVLNLSFEDLSGK